MHPAGRTVGREAVIKRLDGGGVDFREGEALKKGGDLVPDRFGISVIGRGGTGRLIEFQPVGGPLFQRDAVGEGYGDWAAEKFGLPGVGLAAGVLFGLGGQEGLPLAGAGHRVLISDLDFIVVAVVWCLLFSGHKKYRLSCKNGGL